MLSLITLALASTALALPTLDDILGRAPHNAPYPYHRSRKTGSTTHIFPTGFIPSGSGTYPTGASPTGVFPTGSGCLGMSSAPTPTLSLTYNLAPKAVKRDSAPLEAQVEDSSSSSSADPTDALLSILPISTAPYPTATGAIPTAIAPSGFFPTGVLPTGVFPTGGSGTGFSTLMTQTRTPGVGPVPTSMPEVPVYTTPEEWRAWWGRWQEWAERFVWGGRRGRGRDD